MRHGSRVGQTQASYLRGNFKKKMINYGKKLVFFRFVTELKLLVKSTYSLPFNLMNDFSVKQNSNWPEAKQTFPNTGKTICGFSLSLYKLSSLSTFFITFRRWEYTRSGFHFISMSSQSILVRHSVMAIFFLLEE